MSVLFHWIVKFNNTKIQIKIGHIFATVIYLDSQIIKETCNSKSNIIKYKTHALKSASLLVENNISQNITFPYISYRI